MTGSSVLNGRFRILPIKALRSDFSHTISKVLHSHIGLFFKLPFHKGRDFIIKDAQVECIISSNSPLINI